MDELEALVERTRKTIVNTLRLEEEPATDEELRVDLLFDIKEIINTVVNDTPYDIVAEIAGIVLDPIDDRNLMTTHVDRESYYMPEGKRDIFCAADYLYAALCELVEEKILPKQ